MTDIASPAHCLPPGQQGLVVADVAAQDERFLLAVHQPPAMRRMPVPLRGQRAAAHTSDDATQEDVLNLLVDGESAQGTLIVPIVGAPGTGKSHLIRWLAAAMPDRDDLVIRHIPRERTSLPKVVEILFNGLTGPAFGELNRALAKAREQHGTLGGHERMEQVATRLIFRIAELVEFGTGVPWRRAAEMPEELRDALCNRDVLPALLTDAVVRRKLTREDGAVYRLAKDIVDGYDRPEGDDEEDLGFRAEDLTLTTRRGIGPLAARALMSLKLPGHREAAVAVLSDALEVAAADVIGMGSISLADLFEDFRAELLRDGKQLLLLFEDIAIARGLQLDLVDALTTPAIRDNTQRLCTLRVALAVTSTYWDQQAPETLSTRARAWNAEMFDLSLPGDEAVNRAPDLIGRYLNAARLTIGVMRTMDRAQLAVHVPNACDHCTVRERCHATFGTNDSGHGLYPLTKTAAKTLSRLVDRDARPRLVLSDVVSPVLGEHEALVAGTFPSSPSLHALVTNAVETHQVEEIPIEETEALEAAELSSADHERAQTLLRAWMARADDGHDAAVLEAFGLAQIGVSTTARTSSPRSRRSTDRSAETRVAPDVAPRVDQQRGELERWAGGKVTLGPALSRVLRAAIWADLYEGIHWNDLARNRNAALELMGLRGVGRQQANRAVRIENTPGGGALQSGGVPLAVIDANAANFHLLWAVLRRTRSGNYAFQGGTEALARVRTWVAEIESAVHERLRAAVSRRRVTETGKLMVFAASPLVTALAIDDQPSFDTALKVLKTAAPGLDRGAAWNSFHASALSSHQTAVAFLREGVTRSQGDAAEPTALDESMVDAVALTRDPAGFQRRLKTTDLAELHDALQTLAGHALDEESARVDQRLRRIRTHIGDDTALALKTIRDGVESAFDAAATARVLGSSRVDVPGVRNPTLPSPADAAAAVGAAEVAVRAARRGISLEAISRFARLDLASLDRIAEYLNSAAGLLEDSTHLAHQAIAQRDGGSSGTAGNPTAQAAREIIDRLAIYSEELQ